MKISPHIQIEHKWQPNITKRVLLILYPFHINIITITLQLLLIHVSFLNTRLLAENAEVIKREFGPAQVTLTDWQKQFSKLLNATLEPTDFELLRPSDCCSKLNRTMPCYVCTIPLQKSDMHKTNILIKELEIRIESTIFRP